MPTVQKLDNYLRRQRLIYSVLLGFALAALFLVLSYYYRVERLESQGYEAVSVVGTKIVESSHAPTALSVLVETKDKQRFLITTNSPSSLSQDGTVACVSRSIGVESGNTKLEIVPIRYCEANNI